MKKLMNDNCIYCGKSVVNTDFERELYDHYEKKYGKPQHCAHTECEGKKITVNYGRQKLSR